MRSRQPCQTAIPGAVGRLHCFRSPMTQLQQMQAAIIERRIYCEVNLAEHGRDLGLTIVLPEEQRDQEMSRLWYGIVMTGARKECQSRAKQARQQSADVQPY